jgi:hypothetical protein
MRKLISFENFKTSEVKISEYKIKRISEQVIISEQINKAYPCTLFIELSQDKITDPWYFENTQILLNGIQIKIAVSFDSYKKKYSVYCPSLHELKDVTYYVIDKLKEKLTEPKRIGVLTEKKVKDWIKYYEDLFLLASNENQLNQGVKMKFMQSIEGLPVRWYNNNKQGEVIKNGLKFSFTINETHISMKTEVYYAVPNTLDAFLSLSDNKYKHIED